MFLALNLGMFSSNATFLAVLVDRDLADVDRPLRLHEVLVHEDDPARDEGEDDDRGTDDGEVDEVHSCCFSLELS